MPVVDAKTGWLHVENMRLVANTNNYELLAELNFSLSPTAGKALRSGIVLYWDINVSVFDGHFLGFFNELIYVRSDRYSLRYNTLFNDYRVRNEKNMSFRRFSSLSDAVDYLAIIKYDSIILPQSSEEKCVVDLRVKLDIESLPIPLRPIAYFDAGWNLSTNARLECE